MEDRETLPFVRLTVRDLGFPNGATNEEIIERAATFGLELCPAEAGPAYRLHLTNQPMYEYVVVAMKTIADRDAHPRFFSVSRNDDDLWLEDEGCRPDNRWIADYGFLFRFRARK